MRVLGAGLIVLAAVGIGLTELRDRRRRRDCLRALCRALALLRGELDANRAPLPQLISWASERTEREAAAFFRTLAQSLSSLGEQSFSALFEQAARRTFLPLFPEELEELLLLGKVLGRFALPEQLHALSRCEDRLLDRLEAEERRLKEETKLCLGLPAAAGALLALLLL